MIFVKVALSANVQVPTMIQVDCVTPVRGVFRMVPLLHFQVGPPISLQGKTLLTHLYVSMFVNQDDFFDTLNLHVYKCINKTKT